MNQASGLDLLKIVSPGGREGLRSRSSGSHPTLREPGCERGAWEGVAWARVSRERPPWGTWGVTPPRLLGAPRRARPGLPRPRFRFSSEESEPGT